METKQMKTQRGTARANRRMSMDVFKAEREKRHASIAQMVTISYTTFGKQHKARELNPHSHDVATVCDLRNGLFSLSRYESPPEYPANSPCPHRHLLFRYPLMTHAKALMTAERVNAIEVR